MTMARRIVPHPLLSLILALVWLFLVNDLSVGHVLLAAFVGLGAAKLTSAYWPDRPILRHTRGVAEYLAVVLWDIVVSNVQVAYLVLFRRGDSLRSQFITVPLDLRSPEAISALSGTITLTPGTVTADISADGRALLVHCLETADAEATAAQIKHRYERRLREIFE